MSSIRIVVNGIKMEVQSGTTLFILLDVLEKSDRTDMLVEINHQFIHDRAYNSTGLEEGDNIEIIHMATGG